MSSAKILVVDDEPEILELLEIELGKEGYEVIKAQTAEVGIQQSKMSEPHLIIMDIMLPDMNGAEAVQVIKSDPQTKDIPVIFLTAALTKDEEMKDQLGVNVGEHFYGAIAKPIDPQELLGEVIRALEKKT